MDTPCGEEAGIERPAPEDVGIDRPLGPTIQDVIGTRLGRRDLHRGLAALAWPAARPEETAAPDARGRIWIGTDGMPTRAQSPVADALCAADTAGSGRGVARRFFAGPRGAEICGPVVAPCGPAPRRGAGLDLRQAEHALAGLRAGRTLRGRPSW